MRKPLTCWERFDAGSDVRDRYKDDQDCQVRALCTSRNCSYAEAWDLLYRIQGEQRTCDFKLVESLNAGDPRLGPTNKIAFPAVKRTARMTAEQFCSLYPKGRYILRMAHHVAAVVDGKLYDTWNSSRKCVYTAWEVSDCWTQNEVGHCWSSPSDIARCAGRN
jgi:hypothetical protein